MSDDEMGALVEFANDVLWEISNNQDENTPVIQDLALRLGLVVRVPFDPEVHENVHGDPPETGDGWLLPAGPLKESQNT